MTSLTDDYTGRYKTIKELYPQHHRALKLAGLVPKYVLQEVLDLNEGKENGKEEKLERDKQRKTSIIFVSATRVSGMNQPTSGSRS
jgi:hypothetical protein